MKQILQNLLNGHPATTAEVRNMMDQLMRGELDAIVAGAFLALQARNGIDGKQLKAALDVMMTFAQRIEIEDGDAIDNCGTGGDGGGGFNVSTTAAFAIAAAGHTVAKHGNRAVSSTCGSADLLENLGINLSLPPNHIRDCINQVGIGFMFAPVFHPAVRHAVPIRRALKIRTIFNMLGPLANPAGVHHQLIGVFDANLTEVFAETLAQAGKSALVVHGLDGSDEVSLSMPTKVSSVQNGQIQSYQFDPVNHGFTTIGQGQLPGGDLKTNREVFEHVLRHRKGGPAEDVVVLNAGFAMFTTNRYPELGDAFSAARDAIQSGAAWQKVEALIAWTSQVSNAK